MPDQEAVMKAHAAFYEAFGAMDMDGMTEAWAQRDEDVCVHPGWEILYGWRAIQEAWRVIFTNTDYNRIGLTDVSVEILGPIARITCVENLYTVIGSQTIHSRVAATNLLLRTDRGWKMILHHGSPIASEPIVIEESEDLDVN